MTQYIEIFALLSGIVYMVLQIFQNRFMWYFDLLTAGAALYVALHNYNDGSWAPLWAQAIMNSYFLVMAVIGIFTWRKYSRQTEGELHIVRLSKQEAGISGAVALLGIPVICFILYMPNDPTPVADGMSMGISLIAAWFLTRSHLEQWLLWIAADLLAIVVYAEQEAWWMVGLYYCYIISSLIGYIHWRMNGKYISA